MSEEKVALDDVSHEEVENAPTKAPDPKPKPSQAEQMVTIAKESKLFHDQHREPFIFLKGEAIPLRSKKVKQWLSYAMYCSEGKAPNSDALNQAITTLEGKALFEGPQIMLANRIARVNRAFYFDLGGSESVKITPERWEIVDSPILFRRYAHQQRQERPVEGNGNAWLIFNHLNVAEEHRLLLLVYVISCFIPDIPHPIFHPHGPQGAGKTTLFRVIKKLCDPSSIEALITPKDLAQLVQVVAHHHVCLFDNMSDIPGWMSDILAQACTGGGFSKRQLYSDDEDIIFQIKRCIGLNGINLMITKPDLMDRSILLHLDRINPSHRMEEATLWEAFEKDKKAILGGIFDTLAKAMKEYPSVKMENLPRMADFARWGVAITQALGKDGQEFNKAYQGNITRQNEEVVQYNTLAQAMLNLMGETTSWEGTVKQAWGKLAEIAHPEGVDPTFPKTHRTLRKHLEKIRANLMDYGITFSIGARSAEGYPIAFQKADNFSSSSTSSSLPCNINDLESVEEVKQSEASSFATSAAIFATPHNLLNYKDDGACNEVNELNVEDISSSWKTGSTANFREVII